LSYHTPNELDQALDLLASGPARIVAGGTDFFPALPEGRIDGSIVDLTRIKGLRGIQEQQDGGWRIGASTTWSDVLKTDLPPVFVGLKAAAREVGSVQIQNAGTVVGNICNASPAADGVPALMVLDALLEITARDGVRTMPVAKFVTGVRETALQTGEIVTAILIPPQPERAVSAFEKLGSRRYLVISISMVASVIVVDHRGHLELVRLAVGARRNWWGNVL